ncbi:hypothetical protein KKF91_08745 [Myxococcota bacterium]|nr:hypothetical protein [Myxococcota bacterium]MBU1430628.1 hypothetical protein [Myxococcota bacterium]MBU1898963.1 hypothetical protein [Myxococcota bacterium]
MLLTLFREDLLNRAAGLREQPEDRHFSDFIRVNPDRPEQGNNPQGGFFRSGAPAPARDESRRSRENADEASLLAEATKSRFIARG